MCVARRPSKLIWPRSTSTISVACWATTKGPFTDGCSLTHGCTTLDRRILEGEFVHLLPPAPLDVKPVGPAGNRQPCNDFEFSIASRSATKFSISSSPPAARASSISVLPTGRVVRIRQDIMYMINEKERLHGKRVRQGGGIVGSTVSSPPTSQRGRAGGPKNDRDPECTAKQPSHADNRTKVGMKGWPKVEVDGRSARAAPWLMCVGWGVESCHRLELSLVLSRTSVTIRLLSPQNIIVGVRDQTNSSPTRATPLASAVLSP